MVCMLFRGSIAVHVLATCKTGTLVERWKAYKCLELKEIWMLQYPGASFSSTEQVWTPARLIWKLNLEYFDPTPVLIRKINNFQGNLTDISAKREKLIDTQALLGCGNDRFFEHTQHHKQNTYRKGNFRTERGTSYRGTSSYWIPAGKMVNCYGLSQQAISAATFF